MANHTFTCLRLVYVMIGLRKFEKASWEANWTNISRSRDTTSKAWALKMWHVLRCMLTVNVEAKIGESRAFGFALGSWRCCRSNRLTLEVDWSKLLIVRYMLWKVELLWEGKIGRWKLKRCNRSFYVCMFQVEDISFATWNVIKHFVVVCACVGFVLCCVFIDVKIAVRQCMFCLPGRYHRQVWNVTERYKYECCVWLFLQSL